MNNLKWLVGDGKDISFCMIGGAATLFWLILMLILHLTILKLLILLQVLMTGIALFLTKWSMLILWVILLMSWSPGDRADTPCWTLSSKCNFSVKSAYVADNPPIFTSWKWNWTLKIPAKLKGFLWICMHGKLLKNHHRMIRGLVDNDICPCCNNAMEDLKHLFFDCSKIWNTCFLINLCCSCNICQIMAHVGPFQVILY